MPATAMASDTVAIDAHAHVFHRGLAFAPGRRYAPDYDAPLADYLVQLDRHGMTHGVLVQPSFLGTDNSYLVECLQAAGGRLRGIAVVDPGISADDLRALDRAGVVGIRLNLVGQPLPDLAAPEWRTLLERVGALGWQVELQRRAADLAWLATSILVRDIAVVIDHFGLPDPKLGVFDPGFQSLLRLANSPNVRIKISAPYRNGKAGEGLAKMAFPLLCEAFSLDRLLWGSDWPHTQFEASQDYATSRRFLDDLVPDTETRARLLSAPKELFRF